tara:strand:+ start:19299 stop:20183 length:885 start_codon:yes stop_codon:yes gene_type:complete
MKMYSSFTPEENEERRRYINASEAYEIMAGNWLDLYEEKIGNINRDLSDIFQVQLGTYTESFNLFWTLKEHPELFDDDTRAWAEGLLRDEYDQISYVHKTHDFMRATPDCLGIVDGQKAVIDFKHTHAGSYKADQTAEERVIDRYQWQIQQQMMCTGYERGVIVPIYGNNYGHPIILHANYEMQDLLLNKAIKFWEHVTLKIPPVDPEPVDVPTQTHNNMRVITEKDLSTWNCANEWVDLCCEFPKYHNADKKLKEIKSDFKALMPDDVKEITAYGISAKRNRKGAVSFHVTET